MGKTKFLKEFKDFAIKGNAVDMAVGVIIGGAFGKIVTSIVNDIIMPPIGWLTGGVNFTDLKFPIGQKEIDGVMTEVTLNYGNFLQTCLDFLIISFCVFLMVRAIIKLKHENKEEAPTAPPAPTKEQELLAEIRDLLKEKK